MSLFRLQIRTRDNLRQFIYSHNEQYARKAEARGSTALQAGRSRVRFPMRSLEFFIDNLSGRTTALGSTQHLTEMSTRNISWGLMRTVPKADKLTTFLKSGSLNLLDPSGPLQPCRGTAALMSYKKLCYRGAAYIAHQDII